MVNSLYKHNITAEGDMHFKRTGRTGGRPIVEGDLHDFFYFYFFYF